jgi:hypothetical protein
MVSACTGAKYWLSLCPRSKFIVFDIFEDISLSLIKAVITVFWHPFGFIAAKDALHRAVVPTIASSAHALLDVIAPK